MSKNKEIKDEIDAAIGKEGGENIESALLLLQRGNISQKQFFETVGKHFIESIEVGKTTNQSIDKVVDKIGTLIERINATLSVKVENPTEAIKEVTVKNIKDVPLPEPLKELNVRNMTDYTEVLKDVKALLKLMLIKAPQKEIQANLDRYLDPRRPLAVRLSTGSDFYTALGHAIVSSGGGIPFVTPTGRVREALVTADGHLVVDANLSVGDIEIGAVEIKDGGSDTRAVVGTLGLQVDPQPLTAIYHGSKAVPTGTAEVLAGSQTIHSVTIKALSTNTLPVFVGITGVTTGTGFELSAGDSISLDINNLNLIYCIAASGSQVLRYIAV